MLAAVTFMVDVSAVIEVAQSLDAIFQSIPRRAVADGHFDDSVVSSREQRARPEVWPLMSERALCESAAANFMNLYRSHP
jgi:hypothetical protein